jgi:hypothetical protein
MTIFFYFTKPPEMGELFTAATAPSNLLLTILLMLITFYWLTVIIGAIGMDAIDLDLDLDADVDIDVDIDVDVDVDVDADIDPSLLGGQKALAKKPSNFFIRILAFFNFGRIPFMILCSILVLLLWSISVYCNHETSWLNPANSVSVAALWFIPNLIISLFATKIITTPLVPIFAKLNTAEKELVFNGKVGTLMTGIQDSEKGQLKIDIDGSVVSLTVKSNEGKTIKKGEKVVIIDQIEEGKSFIVQKINYE